MSSQRLRLVRRLSGISVVTLTSVLAAGCNLPFLDNDNGQPPKPFDAGVPTADAGDAGDDDATDDTAALDATGEDATTPDAADRPDARETGLGLDGASEAATDAARTDASEAGATCPTAPAGMATRALWAWQTATFTDAATKSAFFDFAASHAVNTVYVQVGTTHMPATGADASPLGRFIAEAAARCIAVELLVGEARWTLEQYHPNAVAIATAAKSFTLALTGPKPTAYHVDIEPHGVKDIVSNGVTYDFANSGEGGTINQRPAMMNQLLDVFGKLKAALGTTLPLHADIPFWFDGSVGINPLQRVTGGVNVGAPRLAHELVIDAVDRTHLMAYRDRAFGTTCSMPSCSADGIYDLSRTEVLYAGTVGKTAVVGVETGDAGDKTSFFEETIAAMDAEIAKVVSAYAGQAGMGGIAVHHYVAYRALQAKTP